MCIYRKVLYIKKLMYEACLLTKKGNLVLYVEVKTNICCSVVAITWMCLLTRMRTFSHQ